MGWPDLPARAESALATVPAPAVPASLALFPGLLTYFVVALVAGSAARPHGSWLSDALVAPLYFLIPAGLGLLVLAPLAGADRAPPLPRTPLLLSAYIVGTVAITLLAQALERHGLDLGLFLRLLPAGLAASLFGFYRVRRLLVWDGAARRGALGLLAGAVAPALLYGLQFFKLAHYPLRDVFQATHFMKGAMELSRFHVLNPFTVDSYIPIAQVHLGLLNAAFGYDLLRSEWLLPPLYALLHLLFFQAFFAQWGLGERARVVAMGLTGIYAARLALTNGHLGLLAVVLVLTLLLWQTRGQGGGEPEALPWKRVGGLVLSATALAVVGFALIRRPDALGVGVLLLVLVTAVGAAWPGKQWGGWALLVLLVYSLPSIHRANLLFLAVGLVIYAARTLLPAARRFRDLAQVYVAMMAVAMATAGSLVALYIGKYYLLTWKRSEEVALRLAALVAWVLGRTIVRADVVMGNVPGMPEVEWLRVASPSLHIVAAAVVLTLLGLALQRLAAQQPLGVNPRRERPAATALLVAMVAGWVVTFICLLDAPHFYRAAPFSALFGVLALAGVWEVAAAHPHWSATLGKSAVVVMGVYTVASQVGLYHFAFSQAGVVHPYLRVVHTERMVVLLAMALCAATLVFARGRKTRRLAALGFLFLGLWLDYALWNFRHLTISYGQPPAGPLVISHYTRWDLQAADALTGLPGDAVLLSDPQTLSIVSARTGLNGAYGFANIDSVRSEPELYFRRSLGRLLEGKAPPPEARSCFCSDLGRYMELFRGNAPELWHIYLDRLGRPPADAVWQDRMYLVLTPRTVRWPLSSATSLGYFPQYPPGRLPAADRLAAVFPVSFDTGGPVTVHRLVCSTAGGPGAGPPGPSRPQSCRPVDAESDLLAQ